MDNIWLNLSLVFFFIALGGVFAASELALVSLRESQIAQMKDRGRRGRIVAALALDPNRFLGAVQIGVTISGFFSAAFGATALAPVLIEPLQALGLSAESATIVAVVTMTLIVAYLSLVFGELAPKRLALQRAVGFSLAVAPIVSLIAQVLSPVIWLVSRSSDAVVRLFGGDPSRRNEAVSDEELLSMVETHEGLDDHHRAIVADAIESAKRKIESAMQPRADVVSVNKNLSVGEARDIVRAQPYSRYPLVDASLDDCDSFVHVRDVMTHESLDDPITALARDIPIVPGSMRIFPALRDLRASGAHIALVVDEYGGADGLVTLEDLVEQVIGEVFDEYDEETHTDSIRLFQTERIVAGDTPLHRFADLTGIELPEGPYSTVAGFVMAALGDIPKPGEKVRFEHVDLEVTEVANRRIMSVRVDVTHTTQSE